jgi:hypothetical protein
MWHFKQRLCHDDPHAWTASPFTISPHVLHVSAIFDAHFLHLSVPPASTAVFGPSSASQTVHLKCSGWNHCVSKRALVAPTTAPPQTPQNLPRLCRAHSAQQSWFREMQAPAIARSREQKLHFMHRGQCTKYLRPRQRNDDWSVPGKTGLPQPGHFGKHSTNSEKHWAQYGRPWIAE